MFTANKKLTLGEKKLRMNFSYYGKYGLWKLAGASEISIELVFCVI